MKLNIRSYHIIGAIIIFGALLFIPFSGTVHLFDWDEIIFAESAREMIKTGEYLTVMINFEPFWEKPPLFIWMQVLSMKAFGINEFAARFPNAICGILTLVSLFLIGRKIKDRYLGIFWVVSYATALLPFFYFQTGIIDPWFNLFIFLGVAFFIFYLTGEASSKRYLNVNLSALFLGLAVLTKGPVAVLIFVLSFVVYLIIRKGKLNARAGHVITFSITLIITGGFWFLLSILKGNIDIVQNFIHYQADLFKDDFAGHKGFPGFHFVILLFGVFPASVLFLGAITKKRESDSLVTAFKTWMYIILGTVLVLFSIVATKLVHYSSLAYFPITFFAAWFLYQWRNRKIEFRKWQLVLSVIIVLIVGSLTIIAPVLMIREGAIYRNILASSDAFTRGVFTIDAGWNAIDVLPGTFFVVGMLIAIFMINRRNPKGMYTYHIVPLLFMYFSMILFVPRVEKMIQQPAIAFIEANKDADVPVFTLGFDSFAPYFYGEWEPGEMPGMSKPEWIDLHQQVKVFVRSDRLDKVKQDYPNIKVIRQKGGFVFCLIDCKD